MRTATAASTMLCYAMLCYAMLCYAMLLYYTDWVQMSNDRAVKSTKLTVRLASNFI